MDRFVLFAFSRGFPPHRQSAVKAFYEFCKERRPNTKIFAAQKLSDDAGILSADISAGNVLVREFLFSIRLATYLVKHRKQIDCLYLLSPIWLCQPVLIIARLSRIQTIFDIRSAPITDNPWKDKVFRFLDKATFWCVDKITSHNHTLIEAKYGKRYTRKTVALPLGFARSLQPRTHQRIAPYKFVMPTTLDKERCVDVICDVFADLTCCHLHVYGDGSEYETLRKRYETSENVHIMGAVSYDEMMSRIPDYDYGIAFIPRTPYYEYQPALKVIEYIGAGLPVIATDTHGNRVYVNDENGLLIEDTPEALSAAIQRITSIPFDRWRIHEKAQEYRWDCLLSSVFHRLGIID